MADEQKIQPQRNLFSTLKRLFSTDVIIRNDGGELKTVDVDTIQVDGVLQTNALVDRFNRIYTTSTSYGVNLNLAQNYQSTRVQIYSDYESMDTDPIVASALDIIADECLGADTIIPLLDGRKLTIKELYDANEENFWLYGLNDQNKFQPVKADRVAYNGEKEVYKITLDDGTQVEATSNHIWISPSGDQVLTSELQIGSSILALPTKISDTKHLKGYEMIKNGTKFEYTHRLVAKAYEPLINQRARLLDTDRPVIHHKSFNKINNHRVVKIEKIGIKPVYDVVNAGDNHIFAIESVDGSKIYTHNCTLKNTQGDVIQIRSSDENIQKILYSLFYDVLNIEFNLWFWIRNMCKYGDFFLKLEVAEKYGVYNVIPFSAYNIVRLEGTNPSNPSEVIFKYDPTAALGATAGYSTSYQNTDMGITFYNYEMAHLRLIGDINYLPYGRSYLEPGRRLFKQYVLMEDAMLVHRLTRAPQRRIFYVNVGAIPPNEVENYMQRMINKMKKTPLIDGKTGQYNLNYNAMSMLEDFFIPVRGNDASTRIDNAPPLEYNGIEDINYLLNKLFAALKIPKAFLGYEKDLTGKATLAAEDIRFARTIERLQRIVLSELTKIALVHLYAHGYDDESLTNFDLMLTTPSIIYEQERIALMKEKMDLAAQMMETSFLPTDWIYDKLFHFSEEEFDEYRDLVVEDKKRAFRMKQIEDEGNDPAESGTAFGTPHQIASMYGGYGNTNLAGTNVPQGYDELNPDEPVKLPGRPEDKVSLINTSDDPLGRDRMGVYDMKSKPTSGEGEDTLKVKYQGGGPLGLKENRKMTVTTYLTNKKSLEAFGKRKVNLFEEQSQLLNENQIKRDLD